LLGRHPKIICGERQIPGIVYVLIKVDISAPIEEIAIACGDIIAGALFA